METLTLGQMTLALPAGFRRMGEDELEEAFGYAWDAWVVARDEARHVMVTVIANEVGAVAGMRASAKDAAAGIERRMRQGHADHGYVFEGWLKGSVGGLKARGFAYRFQVLGIDHIGEVWCVKCARTFMSCYLYGRLQEADTARAVFAEVLDGVSVAHTSR